MLHVTDHFFIYINNFGAHFAASLTLPSWATAPIDPHKQTFLAKDLQFISGIHLITQKL